MRVLPGATVRLINYAGDASVFSMPPLGWILHVQDGNGSPFRYFDGLVHPDRKFSTGWVAKDGSGEQYQDLLRQAWAMGSGNPYYWSFETEGMPDEPLTNPQIRTLAVWHNFLGVADLLAEAPGQRGIGTHYMGGQAWGGHPCPDPVPGAGPRSHQRAIILATAKLLRTAGGMGMTPDEQDQLADVFLKKLAGWDVSDQIGEPGPVSFQTAFGRVYKWAKAGAAAQQPAKGS